MIIGIDLGTTNSLVSVWRDGEATLIPNALGEVLTPSAVSLDADGSVLVGAAAKDRLTSHPDRSAAAFKRHMGTNRILTLAGRAFRAEELSALVLRNLKADAETWLGRPVGEAVITVPAYFNEPQRRATRAAGELAGLRVERLLNEPTAAALAYGLNAPPEPGEVSRVLVLDLGGGTFDVSLLELFEGVVEVRATAGDNFLGGEDFDDALLAWLRAQDGVAERLDAAGPDALGAVRRAVERGRRRLTETDSAEIQLSLGGEAVSAALTRADFDEIAAPLIQRMRRPIERALRDARIQPDQLSRVVLAGGATRMPAIRHMAARLFGRLPLQHLNPDEVVARGAAVQAGLKAQDRALDETVLTDVAPYTLGIEITERLGPRGALVDGRYLPIIERNTAIPASRVETVSTVLDGQAEVALNVFQGESRLVRDNIPLGKLLIPVPKDKAGAQAVDVRFTYDVSGLLEVEAVSHGSGQSRRVVIQENAGAMDPAEAAERLARLADLKVAPRDRAEHRALLARAERIYEESLAAVRDRVAAEISRFEAALETQDPREADRAASRLREVLDALDRELRW